MLHASSPTNPRASSWLGGTYAACRGEWLPLFPQPAALILGGGSGCGAPSLHAHAYPLAPFQVPLGVHVPPADNPCFKLQWPGGICNLSQMWSEFDPRSNPFRPTVQSAHSMFWFYIAPVLVFDFRWCFYCLGQSCTPLTYTSSLLLSNLASAAHLLSSLTLPFFKNFLNFLLSL